MSKKRASGFGFSRSGARRGRTAVCCLMVCLGDKLSAYFDCTTPLETDRPIARSLHQQRIKGGRVSSLPFVRGCYIDLRKAYIQTIHSSENREWRGRFTGVTLVKLGYIIYVDTLGRGGSPESADLSLYFEAANSPPYECFASPWPVATDRPFKSCDRYV